MSVFAASLVQGVMASSARFFSPVLAGMILAIPLSGCGRKEEPAPPPPPARPSRPLLETIQQVEPPPAPSPAALPAETKLPLYEIRMTPRDLLEMDRHWNSDTLHPASFLSEGTIYENVKIRYRGAWGRTWPKKPLKLFFEDTQPFNGQKRLNLNSAWRDAAFLREPLAYHIYAAAGTPASKARLARVHLNGAFRGLYVEVEQPDKAFLQRLGLKGAAVFKADSPNKQSDERSLGGEDAYQQHYEQETQKDEAGYADLKSFCDDLSSSKDALAFFHRRVDLEKYVNYLAATVFCQNWDSYSKNHLLIYDLRGSKKWMVAPWDLDRTLGDHWNWTFTETRLPIASGTKQRPGITGWNRLMDHFFSHPELRKQFAARLQHLLETEFTPEKLHPIIEKMETEMAPEAEADRQLWPNPSPDFRAGVQEVKNFVTQRRAFLLSDLPRFRQAR